MTVSVVCLGDVMLDVIVSITPINYSHIDMGSRQILTDFGIMIVYKG